MNEIEGHSKERLHRLKWIAMMCVLLVVRGAYAQVGGAAVEASPQQLAFDVVSIKQHAPKASNDEFIGVEFAADGINVSGGMPLHTFLLNTFGVTNERLRGEPSWVTEGYDFIAKVSPEDVPKYRLLKQQEKWSMLLPVIEERCALRFHHETKALTTYTLVVAKGGPKLQPSKPESTRDTGYHVDSRRTILTGNKASIKELARMISLQIGSPVVEKTGLTGDYDFSLSFAPDGDLQAGNVASGGNSARSTESVGPSVFAAVQEQLGLKLVAQKEAVDVIVIDHLERPTRN